MIEAGSDQDYEDPNNYAIAQSKHEIPEHLLVESIENVVKLVEGQNKKNEDEINEKVIKYTVSPVKENLKRLASDRNVDKKEIFGIDLGMNVKNNRSSLNLRPGSSSKCLSNLNPILKR